MARRLIITGFTALLLGGLVVFANTRHVETSSSESAPIPSETLQAALLPASSPNDTRLLEPTEEFRQRITKKPFGIFITPETSPIQPDRFLGFHTGVDAEFTDRTDEIPVRAVANGNIVFRRWVSGYGGVIIIQHEINDRQLHALYGHLDASNFPPRNIIRVRAGDVIGVLGDGGTEETDDVRKHLHFSIRPAQESFDLRGYVKSHEELSGWFDPLQWYR